MLVVRKSERESVQGRRRKAGREVKWVIVSIDMARGKQIDLDEV